MAKNPTRRIYSDAVCYCTNQQGADNYLPHLHHLSLLCSSILNQQQIKSHVYLYSCPSPGTFCGVYKFSSTSITRGRNCRYILSDYRLNLAASSILCVVSAIAAIGLVTACVIALCFPTKRLKLRGLTSNSNRNSRRNSTAEISPEMEFGVSSNNFTGEDINYHWKVEINVIENVEKVEALS